MRNKLKTLGEMSKETVGQNILIRSKEIPKIYSNVVTDRGEIIGKVNDIIGPKMDPHIVVKLSKHITDPKTIKNKMLFEASSNSKKREKRWKKKR